MKNKQVLVTGAEGFIGSHLVETLVNSGYNVRALVQYNFRNSWGWLDDLSSEVKQEIEVVTGDIRDPYSTSKSVKGCEKVFHLAALIAIPYSYRAPLEYVQTNVIGTLNVMQASLDHGVSKVIHTSTSEVYGTALYVPIDEKHPLQGQSPYSASKIGADKIAESYFLSFKLPVTTVRPFNTYGPRQSARAVIPTIISQALTQPYVKLGALDPVRDLNYVKDTVRGFLLASEAEKVEGLTVNLCQGLGISIGDLTNKILNILGIQKEIQTQYERLRPEASEVMKLIGSRSLAEEVLSWKPEYDLDQGLSHTVNWVKENLTSFKTDIYNT